MYPYGVEVYPQYLAFPSPPFVSQFPSPYKYPGYKEELAPAHQRIKHNSNYWCPLGWMRLFILIATLGGVISSWCVVSNDYNFSSLEPGMLQTRSALIVIFSIWFSLSLLMFLMSVTNFVNLPGIDSKYYLYAFTLIDFLGCLAFIGVGIAAAVKESNLIWSGVGSSVYRQGTFIACSVFAFFTAILQLVSAGYQFYFVYKLDFV